MKGIESVVTRALAVIGAVLLTAGLLEYAGLRTPGGLRLVPVPLSTNTDSLLHSYQPWCAAPVSQAAGDKRAQAASATTSAAAELAFPVTPFPANFWFVKTVKTGSSTLTSVFHSICSHYGIEWLKTDIARMVVGIGKPKADTFTWVQQQLSNLTDGDYYAITNHMVYNQDVADVLRPAMLFTSVRHPVSRVHSHFVQDACVEAAKSLGWNNRLPHREEQDIGPNACDSDMEFLAVALQNDTVDARSQFASSKSAKDQVYNYIRGDKADVADVASQYDFIFTAERMNEGLVIFMLKYGLTYEDIAYLPLKVRKGRYKTAADMPQELNDFILANNLKDLQLWEIANGRLDEERASLQQQCRQDAVNMTLIAFQQLLGEVQAECSQFIDWYDQHHLSGPFTYTGLADVAYDSGNGYRCVRHVARRFMVAGPRVAGPAAQQGRVDQSLPIDGQWMTGGGEHSASGGAAASTAASPAAAAVVGDDKTQARTRVGDAYLKQPVRPTRLF